MSYSMDSLFLLMVEKIQTINLLWLDKAHRCVKKGIILIKKVIRIKETVGKHRTL